MGVTSNYIYLIESGHKLPGVKFCLCLADFFGINQTWMKRAWLKDYLACLEEKVKKKIGLEEED